MNSSVTEDFEQFPQENGAEYPRVGDVTREIDAFTREFGANTREIDAFTREFEANTREFECYAKI
ncbi:hypothetical protein MRBLBA21_000283 [Peribacillus frigoritolerans]|uniref:hypothetical protein n=1 Tax=Peribacillus frigoritolerans TaxID=450367 RepID=UPI00215B5A66|nr:hypothetical protein [Peribacillus frigoritolerans]MCR8869124.1 hypothetical protein [Peribacillus frigoritolerans]